MQWLRASGSSLCSSIETPMPHPMHLHGHEFQVVEIDGERFRGRGARHHPGHSRTAGGRGVRRQQSRIVGAPLPPPLSPGGRHVHHHQVRMTLPSPFGRGWRDRAAGRTPVLVYGLRRRMRAEAAALIRSFGPPSPEGEGRSGAAARRSSFQSCGPRRRRRRPLGRPFLFLSDGTMTAPPRFALGALIAHTGAHAFAPRRVPLRGALCVWVSPKGSMGSGSPDARTKYLVMPSREASIGWRCQQRLWSMSTIRHGTGARSSR